LPVPSEENKKMIVEDKKWKLLQEVIIGQTDNLINIASGDGVIFAFNKDRNNEPISCT
jgi:hypothetical protein